MLDQLLLHPTCACSYSTPSLNYRVDATLRRRRLRVSPVCSSGLDRPRTCTSLCVLLLPYTFFFAGSSSLSPYVYVLFPRFFTWFCHSRVVARLDVREFYDLYWISTTNRCVRIPKISSIRDRARFPCCVGFNSATAHPVSSRSIPAPRQTGSRENITHSRAR